MPEQTVQQILERLVASRFVQAFDGLKGNRVYRITAAGLRHPQRDNFTRQAEAPRPPVESDRVRKVLSAIRDTEALRIRDVTNMLRIERESINALMQYLKRKHLVEKISQEFNAPYSLTNKGHAALAEMTRRLAAYPSSTSIHPSSNPDRAILASTPQSRSRKLQGRSKGSASPTRF
jgi:DNA-binding PadR family transcriptional regulator